jgi:tetratricopeptide (TPR) repeat protein
MEYNRICSNLEEFYSELEQARFEQARGVIETLFRKDFDNPDIVSAYKACCFWEERYSQLEQLSIIEKGDYLQHQWFVFQSDFCREHRCPERLAGLLRDNVFTEARELYQSYIQKQDRTEPDILLRIGVCSKFLGNFDQAINCFEEALSSDSEKPELLAELADCYSMVSEEKKSKILFREAFYLDPEKVKTERLLSATINNLVALITEKKGYSGRELKEWIPVYGVLFHVFNVKRELRPIDYGKLMQSILTLKKEIKEDFSNPYLKPRLINKYFWLIDHYIAAKKPRSFVDEVLMNINLLDPEIFKIYVS